MDITKLDENTEEIKHNSRKYSALPLPTYSFSKSIIADAELDLGKYTNTAGYTEADWKQFQLNRQLKQLCSYLSERTSFKYFFDKKKRKIYAFEKQRLRKEKKAKRNRKVRPNRIAKWMVILFDSIDKNKINFSIKNTIRGVSIKDRYRIFERDKYTCLRCGAIGSRVGGNAALHIDHILPIFYGGSNDVSNLQTLCASCNLKKHFNIG